MSDKIYGFYDTRIVGPPRIYPHMRKNKEYTTLVDRICMTKFKNKYNLHNTSIYRFVDNKPSILGDLLPVEVRTVVDVLKNIKWTKP